jgi:hypothetical protein
MSNFTQLSESLFALIVDKNAYDFEFFNSYHKEIRYLFKGEINPLTGTEKIGQIDLPGGVDGKWKILFEIRYNDCVIITSEHQKLIGGDIYDLLASKELFWVHPLGDNIKEYVMRNISQFLNSENDIGDNSFELEAEYNRLQSKCLSENQKILILHKTV